MIDHLDAYTISFKRHNIINKGSVLRTCFLLYMLLPLPYHLYFHLFLFFLIGYCLYVIKKGTNCLDMIFVTSHYKKFKSIIL